MKIQYLKIAPQLDGIDALYIDEQLEVQGDEYHDDIGAYIEGFIAGLRKMGFSGKVEVWEWHMSEEELTYKFNGVPDLFEQLPKNKLINTHNVP